MNLVFRVLLAVYAFFLTVLSLFAMVVTLKPQLFDRFTSYISYYLLQGLGTIIATFLVEFIFFALSLLFLFSGFKNDKDKKFISKHTNIGEIKISLNSIENIALTASKRLNGVRETKAYVNKLAEGISILVKIVVLPDINIPVLSEDIQQKVKKAVEESSGIQVNEVSVVVENLYAGYKSRVE
ncbi:MAG: alkaline shock response membrane anchor protein AmaP [Clostridiales bacterium]|jgi:uncharacterized alkaline shock family protein YloU|nr:alkaline shock response membrane anchor protein AmaP [Eubacteriales bacterium]MDH7565233.1 alkaline shock response membrane anchor protein AmaP [Clostridiales bacterium]